MDQTMYFQVEGIVMSDLIDWSDQKTNSRLQIPQKTNVRRLRRRNSQTGTLIELNCTQVALFRYGENVYAINEKCPHAGGPLHIGDIEVLPDNSVCVKCPWHSWCFDLVTGNAKRPNKPNISATVYPVRVEDDGRLLIGFDSFSDSFFKECDF